MAARSRIALALVVAVVAAVGIALAAATAQEDPRYPGWQAREGLPLTQPPQLKSRGGVLKARIRIEERRVFVSGVPLRVSTYERRFVAPTLRVRPGDVMRLKFVNRLKVGTNVHFHGLHVSPNRRHGDNVLIHIRPGASHEYRIRFPRDHNPGTFWYHSHHHGDTEEQVFGGLSGMLIVDGLKPRLPGGGAGVTERIFALKDLQVEPGTNRPAQPVSTQATIRTVNGRAKPTLDAGPAGRLELWHLANIGANLFYNVDLSGLDARIVAEDGNPVYPDRALPQPKDGALLLPPGKRFAVLVRARQAGTFTLRTLAYDQGHMKLPTEDLASITFGTPLGEPTPMPETLLPPPGPPQQPPRLARAPDRPPIVFSQTAPGDPDFGAFIDNRAFELGRVDFRAKRGTVEHWTIQNTTGEEHPFHLHQYDVRVLSVNGQPYDAVNDQDTVLLPRATAAGPGEVVIRVPFADYAGDMVFHCHILGHEDAGMMATLRVRR